MKQAHLSLDSVQHPVSVMPQAGIIVQALDLLSLDVLPQISSMSLCRAVNLLVPFPVCKVGSYVFYSVLPGNFAYLSLLK